MEILYSEVFKGHKPLRYHPENPKRLEFAIEGLKERDLWINVEEPPRAEINDILKVHSNEYVKKIQGLSESGFSFIDWIHTFLHTHGKQPSWLLEHLCKWQSSHSKRRMFIWL